MTSEAKFNKRGAKLIDVDYSTSIATTPREEVERTRVSLTLRDYETDNWFRIGMSRKEAARLGAKLVEYGQTKIDGEL